TRCALIVVVSALCADFEPQARLYNFGRYETKILRFLCWLGVGVSVSFRQLGIAGMTLHSYRYAWAKRPKGCRNAGKIRAGGFRAQWQGCASGVCETRL